MFMVILTKDMVDIFLSIISGSVFDSKWRISQDVVTRVLSVCRSFQKLYKSAHELFIKLN